MVQYSPFHNGYTYKSFPKKQFHFNPKEILMIGNDALEDGIIQSLHADCYLLKDSLLNESHLNNQIFKCTDIQELVLFIQNLPSLK